MISSAIGMIVALAISSLYLFAIDAFHRIVAMNHAQEQLLWTAYHSRNLLSQAVNVTNPSTDPGSGYIYHTTTTSAGLTKAVAGFMREWGQNASQFRQTGIFLVEPGSSGGLAGPVDTMGRVFFDVLSPGLMTPSNDDVSTENIVQYDVVVSSDTANTAAQGQWVPNPNRVLINITTRYFLQSNRDNFRFCPPAELAAPPARCLVAGNPARFRDVRMTVNVSLRNNFDKSGTGSGGVYGLIYYFQFMPPPVAF